MPCPATAASLPPATRGPGLLAGARPVPLSTHPWRMPGMSVTSVGRLECLLSGIPGRPSKGSGHVCPGTHTWVTHAPSQTGPAGTETCAGWDTRPLPLQSRSPGGELCFPAAGGTLRGGEGTRCQYCPVEDGGRDDIPPGGRPVLGASSACWVGGHVLSTERSRRTPAPGPSGPKTALWLGHNHFPGWERVEHDAQLVRQWRLGGQGGGTGSKFKFQLHH